MLPAVRIVVTPDARYIKGKGGGLLNQSMPSARDRGHSKQAFVHAHHAREDGASTKTDHFSCRQTWAFCSGANVGNLAGLNHDSLIFLRALACTVDDPSMIQND